MKLLVSGSRSIDSEAIVIESFDRSPFEFEDIDTVIHGGADGVDTCADRICKLEGVDREVYSIPGWVWEVFGKKVGPMRNEYMVDKADVVLAVWDGKSSGTKSTIRIAKGEGVPLFKVVCSFDEKNNQWVIDDTRFSDSDQSNLYDFER